MYLRGKCGEVGEVVIMRHRMEGVVDPPCLTRGAISSLFVRSALQNRGIVRLQPL